MIALCSKCCFVDEPEGKKNKFSTKGMSKKQNEITWQRFRSALDGNKDMATNMVFTQNQSIIIDRLPVVAVYLEGQPTALWADKQIIDNRRIWFYHNLFDLVNFHRPDWAGSFSPATFKFTGLIEIANT